MEGDALVAVVEKLGPEFKLDDQASLEMVTGTLRYHLRVPSIAFEIELFLLSQDPHEQGP